MVKHRFVMNSTCQIPFGRGQKHGADIPLWADAIIGGWTLSSIFQARSGPNLTPFFTYGTDPEFPANTGRALDGVGQFGEAWRPDVVGNPNIGGSRDAFFDVTAFQSACARHARHGEEGQPEGAGHVDPQPGVLQGPCFRTAGGTNVEFTVLLDNALNHPQFFVPSLGTEGFADLTDYLLNGDANNGSTAVLGADTVGNAEGFSSGRVIRLGLRVRF